MAIHAAMALNLATLLSVLLAAAVSLATRGCSPGNRPGKALIEGDGPAFAATAVATVPVSGTLLFQDVTMTVNQDGTTGVATVTNRPVRFAKIVALDDNATNPAAISDATFTDANGAYTLRVPVSVPFRPTVVFTTEGSGHAPVDVRSPAGNLVMVSFFDASTNAAFTIDPGVTSVSLEVAVLARDDINRLAGFANILDVATTCADFVKTTTGAALARISFLYAPTATDGSFFERVNDRLNAPAITIRGGDATTDDTDEFDDFVIAHEFGHYVAFALSVDSSLGGTHFLDATANPPLAYSEGLASFFAGLVTANPVQVNTAAILGATNASRPTAFVVNLETRTGTTTLLNNARGITSELTVGEFLWDLFDGTQGRGDGDADGVALTALQFFQALRALKIQPFYASLLAFLDAAVGLGQISTTRVQTLTTSPDDQKIQYRTATNPDVFPTPLTIPANLTSSVTTSSVTDFDTSTDDQTNRFFQLDLSVRSQITLSVNLGAAAGTNASGTNVDLALLTVDNVEARDTSGAIVAGLSASRQVNPETVPATGPDPIIAAGRYIVFVHGRRDFTGGPQNASAQPVSFTLSATALAAP